MFHLYVVQVTVEDVKTREVFEFPCEEWFGDDSGGLLSRDIECSNITIKEPTAEKGKLNYERSSQLYKSIQAIDIANEAGKQSGPQCESNP